VNSLDIIAAARVPASLPRQLFGPWYIDRHDLTTRWPWDRLRRRAGFDTRTVLKRCTPATAHLSPQRWEIVMEDSAPELRMHLPIFNRGSGRVLVTGLGLGCVIRGLLAKPDVTHIDVVEIDPDILRVVGEEFTGNPRVTLHCGDALTIRLRGKWDFAWHDLWTDGPDLQSLHAELFVRFADVCGWQGAWQFPGNLARGLPWNQKRDRGMRSAA
jgi:hypothetical protein